MRISGLLFCVMTAGAAFAGQNPPQLSAPPPGFGPRPAPAKQPDKSKSSKDKPKSPAPAPKAEQGAQRAQRRAAPAAPAPAPVKQAAYGPGQDVGDGFRACVAGDTTPAGTVKQGYRKFEADTPFGHSCRWEKAPGAPDSPAPAAAVASAGPPPGVAAGGNYRGCAPSDDAPAGTEKNGFRKVIAQTPFGKTCRWEPIQGEGTAPASTEIRACDANDASPAGTVRDGFRKVEGMTVAGKTCRWERTLGAQ